MDAAAHGDIRELKMMQGRGINNQHLQNQYLADRRLQAEKLRMIKKVEQDELLLLF
jgi:hypothetical protein